MDFGLIVDVVISLATVFALFSLLCTAIQEMIATWLNRRGRHLEYAISDLLGGSIELKDRLHFWRVSTPEEFGAKTRAAVAHSGPSLVEVDMTAIGPHPPYFPYGPKAEAVD